MPRLTADMKSQIAKVIVDAYDGVESMKVKEIEHIIANHNTQLDQWTGQSNEELSRKVGYFVKNSLKTPKLKAVPQPPAAPVVQETVVEQKVFKKPALESQQVSFIPQIDPNYVKNGDNFKTIENVLNSGKFFPIFITGLSGNGKTLMVEQICAKLQRPMVRVQVTPETDETDLIGGYQLIDGNTVFQEGPVLQALKTPNCVLLIDEIDRGTNKIMCLQGILEGKPYLNKKTGEVVTLEQGVNVIATANTKGQGDETGSFSAASIIDEAFLERFAFTIEQQFPTQTAEKKILAKVDPSLSEETIDDLTKWAMVIRKTYEDDAIEDVISTRRLVHIVNTNMIIGNMAKSIELCVARFEKSTKESFLDLFSKIGTYEDHVEHP